MILLRGLDDRVGREIAERIVSGKPYACRPGEFAYIVEMLLRDFARALLVFVWQDEIGRHVIFVAVEFVSGCDMESGDPRASRLGKRDGLQTKDWAQEIQAFSNIGDEVKLVKTSSGPGLLTTKKDVVGCLRNHDILAAIYKANLA